MHLQHIHTTLTNRNTTPIREHPSRNVHSGQLLEEQLSGVRDDNLRDLGLVLARSALKLALAQAGDGRHETADLADVHAESVRDVEETLLEEGGGAVRDHAITFHLSETKTTVTCTTFDWLTRQDLQRTTSAGVDLVVNHVTETLVVGWAKEDLGGELLAGVTVVHDFETTLLEPVVLEDVGDGCEGDIGERRGVAFLATESTDL